MLAATGAGPQLEKFSADQIRVVVALLSGSQALGNLLVAHPDWLSVLDIEQLKFPRRAEGFRREIEGWLKPKLEARDYAGALAELRRFKQREMLRIAARDLARLSNVVEITREISDLADVCLDAVLADLPAAIHRAIRPAVSSGCGRELAARRNFACSAWASSAGRNSITVPTWTCCSFTATKGEVFKEPPAKKKTPRAVMSNHQFFNKLAEAFIAEVSRVTAEGLLFRIDLRLRPEGDAGPLCRSLESYENYYTEWGQTWERMMLIKARGVAGDEGLAAEFLEMIQPFRFPRFAQRRRAPRSRRGQGSDRKGSRGGGRTGAQRQTGARRHPGN